MRPKEDMSCDDELMMMIDDDGVTHRNTISDSRNMRDRAVVDWSYRIVERKGEQDRIRMTSSKHSSTSHCMYS